MWSPEFHMLVKREQVRDLLAAIEEERRAAMLRPGLEGQTRQTRRLPSPVVHNAPRRLGCRLHRLQERLLRVGAALHVCPASARSQTRAQPCH